MSLEPPKTSPQQLHHHSLLLGLGVGALLASALTVGLLSLSRRRTEPPQPVFTVRGEEVRLRPGALPPIFETAQVREGPPLAKAPMTARVAPVETRTAPCLAPLEGRVDRVVVSLGDRVQQGARLLRVRSGDLATMLRELHADAATARTKKTLVERTRILVESRAASENELLVAQNELNEAELAARAADSRLKSLAVAEEGDNLYWVLATRAGTVIQLDAVPGQHVGPNRERPVATIADLDEVLVLADVPQQEAAGLRAGRDAQIRLPGVAAGAGLLGRVETISEVVDPERQTVPVRIRAQNPGHQLRPNAFVEAVFAVETERSVVLLPTDSVVSDGLRAVVFVETEAGVFRRRQVVVGRQAEGQSEILSGLKAGEKVVIRGALLLLNAIDLEG